MDELIFKQAAIDALWKALYEYEDKTEKQFQESEDLDVGDWIGHRIFVQNMNDIDRQTILNLPPAHPETCEYWDDESDYCALYRPSAVLVRKKGRWINDNGLYRCSSCNQLWAEWWAASKPIERMKKEAPYCPICGSYNGEGR